jgi:hypothetical protein
VQTTLLQVWTSPMPSLATLPQCLAFNKFFQGKQNTTLLSAAAAAAAGMDIPHAFPGDFAAVFGIH